jgi:hypothetical protein
LKLALLREPLLQFMILGAALFGLFHLVDSKKAEAPTRIVISSARVANLADGSVTVIRVSLSTSVGPSRVKITKPKWRDANRPPS